MPLFGRHADPEVVEEDRRAPVVAEPTTTEEPARRRSSLFGRRRRSISPANTTNTTTTTASNASSTRRRGLLHRNDDIQDPSIINARERVFSAEAAEKEADQALLSARAAVREAREHVKRLEYEAGEEARLAKIKQHHARNISKRAKPLGRHGPLD